ncbi:MAG: hypothetical protein GY694_11645, partial [Gammaproteobacteria bacterium]|nr:hypothetical protein [Gammaproteobacteria bacterium]
RRWTLYAQISVMLMYSVILSIMQPIFWLHPFAPIIKNLAMLVLAMYLLTETPKDSTNVSRIILKKEIHNV